jgi:hypothetical protein
MQKREKIIVVLVIIAMIYGAIDFTLTRQKKKATLAPAKTTSQSTAELTTKLQAIASPNDQKINGLASAITEPWPDGIFALAPINFDNEKKEDETKIAALNDLRAKADQLVYSGFVATDSDRIAIINNMDYRIGEQINGFTITKITQESVQISQEDAIFDIPATTEQAPDPAAEKAPNPQNNFSHKALP